MRCMRNCRHQRKRSERYGRLFANTEIVRLELEEKLIHHFYFIRHGETIWNVENKICGVTDIELTELGHKQAIEAGQKILEMGIYADEILTSPLVRASETARHISEIIGIPVREEPRLVEQCFGKYEATPRDGKEFHEARKQCASLKPVFCKRYGRLIANIENLEMHRRI